MKPFDLEAAKRGEPVQTRDGRKARIVCWDAEAKTHNTLCPLVCVIGAGDGQIIALHSEDGVCISHNPDLALFMAQRTVTRWRVIYRDDENCAAMQDFINESSANEAYSNLKLDALVPFKIEVTL